MHKISKESKLWINNGVYKSRKIIYVTALYEELGASLTRALPAFHAITGCDYNPAFHWKGKQQIC